MKTNQIKLQLWTEQGSEVGISGPVTNEEIEAILKILCPKKQEAPNE